MATRPQRKKKEELMNEVFPALNLPASDLCLYDSIIYSLFFPIFEYQSTDHD
jgi:hypothetical protein